MNPINDEIVLDSANECRAEIITLLARGFLRLRSRQSCSGAEDLSADTGDQNLEVSGPQSVCGLQKERTA